MGFRLDMVSIRVFSLTDSKKDQVQKENGTSGSLYADIGIVDVISEILSLKYLAKCSQREIDVSGKRLTFGWRTDSIVENRMFGLWLFHKINSERYLHFAALAAC